MQADQFWDHVDKSGGPDACWPWIGSRNKFGYGRLWWKGKQGAAHRVSVELSGRSIEGLCVCHHCDNTFCVNPTHLFVGTQQDNMRDAVKKRRHHRKFSDAQVAAIREAVAAGEPQQDVAARFGASRSSVSFFARGVYRTNAGGTVTKRRIQPEDVPVIRQRMADGDLLREVAADYNVTSTSIYYIATGQSYKKLGGPRTRRLKRA